MDYLAFHAQTYPQIYTLAIAKRGVRVWWSGMCACVITITCLDQTWTYQKRSSVLKTLNITLFNCYVNWTSIPWLDLENSKLSDQPASNTRTQNFYLASTLHIHTAISSAHWTTMDICFELIWVISMTAKESAKNSFKRQISQQV